jgi:hypothetical protein
MKFFFTAIVSVVFALASCALKAEEVHFHAKFQNQTSELHIRIPTKLIEPTLKEHYEYLDGRSLTLKERNIYLEMYLRETVKLQYGAFPMALGESGIQHSQGMTKLVMKLAKLPKEARELLVTIDSFAENPQQKNVFKLTKSYQKQTIALHGRNAFTANVAL